MAEPATEKKKTTSMMSDWSQLPEELLHVITKNLDNCFDVVHARSVCSSWRSVFPFPSCLLCPSYSLPTFGKFPCISKDLCTLEKIPLFLFRVKTPPVADAVLASEYFLGGIGRDKHEDHTELPSPIQCSVKVEIQKSDPALMNMLDCQIFPLGHQYRMICWDPEAWTTDYRRVAFLPLNKEGRGGGEFVVLLNYTKNLLVLRSSEMRWMFLMDTSDASCSGLLSFRGRFYATFMNGVMFSFDPYSLIPTPLMPSLPPMSSSYLIQSGDDELFLVQRIDAFCGSGIINFSFVCRVSRLDEEAGKWVVVSDLGDRVFFIGHFGNVCCSAKDLPDGCGVSRNSIVFTNERGNVTFTYKYCGGRLSRENRVTILSTSSVVSLRVERQATNPTLDS